MCFDLCWPCFHWAQCLKPWLDGLPDPAVIKSDLAGLGTTLQTSFGPAISGVATNTGLLAVGLPALSCERASGRTCTSD